jgi:hypothetical protein
MALSILRWIKGQDNCALSLISILGVLVCLLPLFLLNSQYDRGFMSEEIPFLSYDFRRSTSVLASIFVVIIPLVDILLDFFQKIWNWINGKQSKTKESTKTIIYRLTDIERFVFITGMVLQSAIIFVPSYAFDEPTMGLIYFCTKGAAQILLIAPILFYLQRCTTTFTPLIIASVLISIVIGLILFALKTMDLFDRFTRDRMKQTEKIFIAFGVFLFLLTVIVCFIRYCIEIFCTLKNYGDIYNLISLFMKKNDKSNENMDYIYTHYIPALHMSAYIILSVCGFAAVVSPISWESYNYTSLVGQIMVLVIELRIRKYEVARELVRYMYINVYIHLYICIHIYILIYTYIHK